MPELSAIRPCDIQLPQAVFKEIQGLMHRRFGISFGDHKKELIVSRLADRLRQRGLHSYEEYMRLVLGGPGRVSDEEELSAMVDVLTTNHTSLYREPEHFEYLESTALPALKAQPSITIWSAGCATGEEPYSIACWLIEKLGGTAPKISILATDISRRALKAASTGVYNEDRFAGLPDPWRRRFLLRGEGKNKGRYRFKPEIRDMIAFRYLNLHEPFTHVGIFDIVFCRNVMIYFDQQTREELLTRLANQLRSGGYYFPGHAESLSGEPHGLRRVHPAVFQKI